MALIHDISRYRMHAKQAAFHKMRARVRLLIGANRSGKSVTSMAEAAMVSLGLSVRNDRIPVPNHGWIVSEDHKVSTNVAEKLFRTLIPRGVLDLSKWDFQLRKLTLPNGSTVSFKSCDSGASKFAGDSIHWVAFDEPPDEDVYVECAMRVIDTRGDMWFAMTPVKGKRCWTYERFYVPWERGDVPKDAAGLPDFDIIQVSIYDNPYIDRAEIERIRRGLAEHEVRTRLYGDYTTPEGQMFPEFDPQIHVVEHEKLPKLVPHWPIRISMDHGASLKTKGATCAHLGALRDDGVLQVVDEYYQEIGKPAIVHAEAIRRLVPAGLPMPVVHLDQKATGFKLELLLQGLSVVDAVNDHNQSFSRLREMLMRDSDGVPGIVFSSRCKMAIRQIPGMTWDGKNINDHAFDSARYLACSMPRRPETRRGKVGLTLEEREMERIAKKLAGLKRQMRYEEYGREGMG